MSFNGSVPLWRDAVGRKPTYPEYTLTVETELVSCFTIVLLTAYRDRSRTVKVFVTSK